MKCPQDDLSDREAFFRKFAQKIEQQRIPLHGGIEITRRCNLSCVHCYLGDEKHQPACIRKELDTRTWQRIIDEITEAGCLFLLFTGGEPLLRKDFSDIYVHARTKGLIVTVFTNGTRITDDIVKIFQEYPPHQVEITLYGATEETYRFVTGRPGEFEKCMSAMDTLIAKGFNVELKTILMTKNRHEFSAIEHIADERGIKFRFDAAIFPCFDGDRQPLDYRVSPNEAVAVELSSDRRRKEWVKYAGRQSDMLPLETLYDCGAGLSNFHIDPYGNLQPCVMTPHINYSLIDGNFIDGWREEIIKIRDRKSAQKYECTDCSKRMFCGFCPAFFRLETGSEIIASEYICAVGQEMEKALKKN